MRRTLPLLALFFLATPCLTSQELLTAPESVPAGEALAVCGAASGPVLRLEVTDLSHRTIVRASTGVVRMTPMVETRCFLIGIDTTVTPGPYRLVGSDESGSIVYDEPLEVLPVAYADRSIYLGAELSTLRASDDPRKAEESRLLSDLILTFDEASVFHLGPLAMPIDDARVSSTFGDRRTYFYASGETATTIHLGLDLVLPAGTPIHSSGRGVVRMARHRILTGNTVVVEHLPGMYTLYYHMASIEVVEGQWVETGTVLGTLGSTGLATGPHLHWEVRVAGVAVNPERLVEHAILDIR